MNEANQIDPDFFVELIQKPQNPMTTCSAIALEIETWEPLDSDFLNKFCEFMSGYLKEKKG